MNFGKTFFKVKTRFFAHFMTHDFTHDFTHDPRLRTHDTRHTTCSHTPFGIKKHSSKSIQYQPKLFINHLLVPRIEIGESFRYLGRYFNFNMSDENHQSEIFE